MSHRIAFVSALLLCSLLFADVSESDFGKMPDGTAVRLFTITNKTGSSIKIATYGATVTSLKVPDHSGRPGDVVLGYDQLDGYLKKSPFFGAIVGRYGNRIGGAKFTLNGVEYKLNPNDRLNILHGGRRGFDKVVWQGAKKDDQSVEFTYLSKDGEEGFPGNLSAKVRYTFSDANELKIEYSATTDKDTVVNLTSHSYFNLAGAGSGDILSHELMIDANEITPVVRGGIPTGKFMSVENTPFDFRKLKRIGHEIDLDDEQLRFGSGYDHNWVLTKKEGLRLAVTLHEPTTGRTMELWTTEPGMQFYTGNGLDGTITGKDGKVYGRRSGLCLEPQHFPDSPNRPEFPSAVLKMGQTYLSQSVYKFRPLLTSRARLDTLVGSVVTIRGEVVNTKVPTIIGVDVSLADSNLRGRQAEATGLLERSEVTQSELDEITARKGAFPHRGAEAFYRLRDLNLDYEALAHAISE